MAAARTVIPFKRISTGDTNAALIVAGHYELVYLSASNINASPRYLKLFDRASAPDPSTHTPVHTFLIPGNTAGAGTNIPIEGIDFLLGIAICIVTGAADGNSGAVAAGDIIVNGGYKKA